MDVPELRSRLEALLDGLDWGRGQTKTALRERVGDDEALARIVARYLLDTVYFSPRDVVAGLPEAVWRGDEPVAPGVPDSETIAIQLPGQPPVDGEVYPFRLEDRGAGAIPTAQRAIPAALSAVVEGLGQAYNRQPTKAMGYLIAGMALGTASGLLTWLGNRLFGWECPIGPRRTRPFLLGLWSAVYLTNIRDAWANADPRLPRSWRSLAPPRVPTSVSAKDITAELPALDG